MSTRDPIDVNGGGVQVNVGTGDAVLVLDDDEPVLLVLVDDGGDDAVANAVAVALQDPAQEGTRPATSPLTNAGPVSGCHCHSDTPAGALAVLTNHPASTVGSTHPLPASVTSIGFPTNMRDVGTPYEPISSRDVPGNTGQLTPDWYNSPVSLT